MLKIRRGTIAAFLIGAAVFSGLVPALGPARGFGQTLQARESDVEKLLSQADDYSKKDDYKLAIGCYLEASALSQNRMNLSRAYFGLALCYFYLQDTAGVTKYLRKVFEVDPNKQISALFYPEAFVGIFDQIRSEAAAQAKLTTEQVATAKPIPEKTEAAGNAAEGGRKEPAKKPAETPPSPVPAKKTAPPAEAPAQTDFEVASEDRSGHWEVSAHYSTWSINLIKTLFEDTLRDKLGEEIQSRIVKKSEAIQTGLVKLNFTNGLAFDSTGSNYGLEVRYYASGRAGTFSLGFGLDLTDITLTLNGTLRQEYTNGGIASVDAKSTFAMSPLSWHVNFRWDVGQNAQFTPYFVAGLGFAPLRGTVTYSFLGTFTKDAVQQSITDSQEKTLDELATDVDFSFPDVLVILQLHFGIKAQLYRGLALLGEVGIWDGFVFRGGLAYRF